MKRRLLIQAIALGCITLAAQGQTVQERHHPVSVEASPYALFGDSTRTLDCQPLEMSSYDIPVVLDDGSSAMLTLDIPNHLAELKDEEGRVLATDTLPKHLQAIFLSVDPKASDYPHVSPYAYCMGNPVRLIDPFGLAPGDFFKTVNAAAIDFGLFFNDNSIREGREYSSSIYVVYNQKGEKGYSYSIPNVGKKHNVDVSSPPMGHLPAAEIHTHGKYDKSFYNNEFSGLRDHHGRFYSKQHLPNVNVKDVGVSNTSKIISYVVTPNGSLQKYNPYTNKITVISNDMPSDVNDPNRLNKNYSLIEKNPMDISDYLKIWRKIITDNYE